MKARQKSKNRYMNIDLSEPHSEFLIRKAAANQKHLISSYNSQSTLTPKSK